MGCFSKLFQRSKSYDFEKDLPDSLAECTTVLQFINDVNAIKQDGSKSKKDKKKKRKTNEKEMSMQLVEENNMGPYLTTLKGVYEKELAAHQQEIAAKDRELRAKGDSEEKENIMTQQMNEQQKKSQGELQVQKQKYEAKMQEISEKKNELEENAKKLQEDINRKEGELSIVREEAKVAKEHNKEWEADLKTSERKVERLQKELDERKSKRLSDETDARENGLTVLEETKSKNQETEEKLMKANERVQNLEKELDGIKGQKLQDKVQRLQKELDKFHSDHKKKLEEKDEEIRKERKEMERQLDEVKQQNDKLKENLKESEESVKAFQERELRQNNMAQSIQTYKDEIARKDQQIQSLTTKLSAEMSTKLAADETNVENVSIKNRPMNVSEEYQMACTDQWLEAKDVLDNEEDIAEHVRLQLLCQIIQVAEKEANAVFEKINQSLELLQTDGINFVVNTKEAMASNGPTNEADKEPKKTTKSMNQLCKELTNSFSDRLRIIADSTNIKALEQRVKKALDDSAQEDCDQSKLWNRKHMEPDICKYVSTMSRVCWKMVIQRPSMTFRFTEEYLGDKMQDLAWNSKRPGDGDWAMVIVYPMLYHGQNHMAKGKVLLVDPKTLKEKA